MKYVISNGARYWNGTNWVGGMKDAKFYEAQDLPSTITGITGVKLELLGPPTGTFDNMGYYRGHDAPDPEAVLLGFPTDTPTPVEAPAKTFIPVQNTMVCPCCQAKLVQAGGTWSWTGQVDGMGRRIAHGGMFRCCVEALVEKSTPDHEGETFSCPHCDATLKFEGGTWSWQG